MLTRLAVVLFLIAAGAVVSVGQTCTLCDEFVALHNNIRANGPFGPGNPAPNPPLAPLTWSTADATVAANWAATCIYGHNPNRGFLGENIYWQTGSPATAQSAMSFWAGEANFYNWATNTCAAGVDCGHYTQIVWDTTTQVGCAIQACPAGFGTPPPGVTSAWSYVVCNYSPPGNIVGLRPYTSVLAAEVSLSGRVASTEGRGITNTVVTLPGRDNKPHTFITGRSGEFHFDSLASGETYVVTVQARRFTFDPSSRVYTLNDNVSNADFTGEPAGR